MNFDIGIVYSGSGSKLLCCTSEGVFLEDSFFGLKEKYDNVVWFTNLKQEELEDEDRNNFKADGYFGEEMSSFMSFYGMKITKENVKLVIKKNYDFVCSLIDSGLNQNNHTDNEKSSGSLKAKREKDRVKLLMKSSSYAEWILFINHLTPKALKLSELNYIDNYGVNQIYQFYPSEYYKIPNTTQNRNFSIWFKIHSLKKENCKIAPSKQFEIDINTLTKEVFDFMPVFELFDIENYVVVNLEGKIKTPSDYKKIIEKDFNLFRINIAANDKNSIFSSVSKNDFIVSKSLLLQILKLNFFKFNIVEGLLLNPELSNQLVEISKIEKEIEDKFDQVDRREVSALYNQSLEFKKVLPEKKVFSTGILSNQMSEELLRNKYQTSVYLYNYLQTVYLNDNFLLNELIKSELLIKQFKILQLLESKGIEVIYFDECSIRVSIGHEEKESLRNILEEVGLPYSSKLF